MVSRLLPFLLLIGQLLMSYNSNSSHILYAGYGSEFEKKQAISSDLAGSSVNSPEDFLEQTMLTLYEFDFKKAGLILKELESAYPDSYQTYFSRINYYWWLVITGMESNDYAGVIKSDINRSLSVLRRSDEANLTHADLFYLIGIHSMHTRIDIMNNFYVRAIRNGRLAIGYIEKSQGMESAFGAFFLTSGLYNYLSAQVIRKYPYLMIYGIVLPRGDRKLGLNQLQKASESEHLIWQTEANYFLMRIFLEMEDRPDLALKHAAWLTERFASNLVFQYYHMMVYKSLGDDHMVRVKSIEIRSAAARNISMTEEQRNHFYKLTESIRN